MSNPSPESRVGSYNPHVKPNAHVGQLGGFFTQLLDKIFRTQEECMWRITGDEGINFDKVRANLLPEQELLALRGAAVVASLHDANTNYRLGYFREDHEMTSFGVAQGYNGLKRYGALLTYLEVTRSVSEEDLADELKRIRGSRWDVILRGNDLSPAQRYPLTVSQTYTQAMVEDRVDALFFSGFTKSTLELVLGKQILPNLSQDADQSSQFYLEKGRQMIDGDESGSCMGEVEEFLLDRIPGPRSMYSESYREAMRKVGQLDQAALVQTLDQVGKLIGRDRLVILVADSRFRARILDQWDIRLPDNFFWYGKL